ncbi:hypothetical protein [Neisseria meningitidis]|uniref:hypothetical protein n=1 Tax=Neisseria meningitidis TaxID=487 RepID=UPI0001FC0C8A|nr:hypothetical protein [Neisseria meningitidis]EGC64881.1 hypothetical protein NMB9615945_0980 [Neisseria meningitidis 961-5945]ADY93842.1 conserved hypothetical protein [Neisseria meningitidis G2136]AKM91037.1 hypothetical protein B6116_01560 [Neisseria meningitidis]ELK58274.1 putative gid protein [Neisseria meningitidis 87255]ELK59741.1 putative gid protein [Neisseria meningitidis 98080]
MPAALIKDFLLTQGLKLPLDEVRAAYLTAQTVMDMGTASIERSVLWLEHEDWRLADYLEQNSGNEEGLKRLFMALDSVFSRSTGVRSAAVYALMPSESQAFQLICLSRQGEVLENLWDLDEAAGKVSLACRSAQSGWMNIASDVGRWLALGELSGERNRHSAAQLSIPVCTESGGVLGVVHVEFEKAGCADEAAQAEWIALALALSEPLKQLLGITAAEGDENV